MYLRSFIFIKCSSCTLQAFWNFLLDQTGLKKPKTSIDEILRVLFWNMGFNFAYFEIEESFGLVWVKLQKGRFHLQISNSGI